VKEMNAKKKKKNSRVNDKNVLLKKKKGKKNRLTQKMKKCSTVKDKNGFLNANKESFVSFSPKVLYYSIQSFNFLYLVFLSQLYFSDKNESKI
jgi:hypothetical protein